MDIPNSLGLLPGLFKSLYPKPHRIFCVNFFILSPHDLFNSLASYALQCITIKPVVINGEVLCLQLLLYHLPTHLD